MEEERSLVEGRLISRGGSSWVSHGIWSGKQVAIKKINPDSETQIIKNSQKFITEKTILTLLGSHPSIIQLLYAIDDKRTLILEVGERELRSRLFSDKAQLGPVTVDLRMKYTVQIAEGVIYIQSKKIAHLDLNLENVVVMQGGQTVKIIDFERAVQLKHSEEIYQGECTFGTPGYMAPECQYAQYGFKTDVWSFGIMMWGLIVYQDPRKPQIDYTPPDHFPECAQDKIDFFQSFWKRDPIERPIMSSDLIKQIKSFLPTDHHEQEESSTGSSCTKCSIF
ncbi:MAG: protein kinase [Gammaproteobacteria bacterium]|nr:protein kinase [Gammaproteobacteria bacterium]